MAENRKESVKMLEVTWKRGEKAFHNCFLFFGEILLLAAVKAASWQLLWKGLKYKKCLVS